MNYKPSDHTFVICAYKENHYLENCIRSLLEQSVLGEIRISTATPNDYIYGLAEKYDLPVEINRGPGSMMHDFNFAYSTAKTKLVTLCHQDDYYGRDYLETALAYVNRCKKFVILFTDYMEDRGGEQVSSNRNLIIKRVMNVPFLIPGFRASRWVKRRVLGFGNPICCPSVMFNKEAIPGVPFTTEYNNSLDWSAWVKMTDLSGAYIYCPHKLMTHRIWSGSCTTEYIHNGSRSQEDYEILCSLWPEPIAKMIYNVYSKAEESN